MSSQCGGCLFGGALLQRRRAVGVQAGCVHRLAVLGAEANEQKIHYGYGLTSFKNKCLEVYRVIYNGCLDNQPR